MEANEDDATQSMQTLSECVNKAVKLGYTENFKIAGHRLATEDQKMTYDPGEVIIANFYRFEGYSDPQDNAILYLIEAKDGKKGMLIDAYGAYADAKLSNFIRQVEDIQKKPKSKGVKGWFYTLISD